MMSRKSRLAVLAVVFFFFHAGLIGAYVRCLDVWPNSGHHLEIVRAGIQNSNSDHGIFHCPEDAKAYRLVQAQHSTKKDPRTEREKATGSKLVSAVVTGYANLTNYSGPPFAPWLSPFPYPSIAIYQAKVVYRI